MGTDSRYSRPEPQAFEIVDGTITISMYDADIILVTWEGTVSGRDAATYLPALSEWLTQRSAICHLVYDLSNLGRFDRDVLRRHATFSDENSKMIGKIAVVTTNAMHTAAVAVVNMLQRKPLRSFPSVAQAAEWVRA